MSNQCLFCKRVFAKAWFVHVCKMGATCPLKRFSVWNAVRICQVLMFVHMIWFMSMFPIVYYCVHILKSVYDVVKSVNIVKSVHESSLSVVFKSVNIVNSVCCFQVCPRIKSVFCFQVCLRCQFCLLYSSLLTLSSLSVVFKSVHESNLYVAFKSVYAVKSVCCF